MSHDEPGTGAHRTPALTAAVGPASAPAYTVVVPTVGRTSLGRLLASLAATDGPAPREVILVDDRRSPASALPAPSGVPAVRVLRTGGGEGPAAARNVGWREARTPWVVFLDDDVEVAGDWCLRLAEDLSALHPLVAGSQGRISVPLPEGRRPTDWERNVAGLEVACWATADMAYRRDVLDEVGGFDERFARAYREDADLGLRVTSSGWLITRGERRVTHPVRPAGPAVSVRMQAGNADDVTMRVLHGPDWRMRCHAGGGRTARHVVTTASLPVCLTAFVTQHRRSAAVAAAAWAAATAAFSWERIAPGPRSPREVATMIWTSAVIPPAAVCHAGVSWVRWARSWPRRGGRDLAAPYPTVRNRLRFGPVPRPVPADPYWEPKAVLFDRDGTLIEDRHHLGDPGAVAPMPGARVALGRIRASGLATGVVTNQGGVGEGLVPAEAVERVNRRVEELLGRFSCWAVCCHSPSDGCRCRKPEAGLIVEAARRLGVAPGDCAVIGDIGADVEAARRAGARAVLVPTGATRAEEVRAAYQVAPDLLTAVDLVLAGRC